MKGRMFIALLCVIILTLGAVGIFGFHSKESTEDKICTNQKFTLRVIDTLAESTQGFVGVSPGRTADDIYDFIQKFQTMRDEIERRLDELDDDYC